LVLTRERVNNLTGLGNYSRSLVLQLSEFSLKPILCFTAENQSHGQIFQKKTSILSCLKGFTFMEKLWNQKAIKKDDNTSIMV